VSEDVQYYGDLNRHFWYAVMSFEERIAHLDEMIAKHEVEDKARRHVGG
jgi:hypothetical protein